MVDIKDTAHIDFLIKRWNKISSALYAVSEYIKDSDQLKWNIRNRSLEIVSFMHDVAGAYDGHRQVAVDSVMRELALLSSEYTLGAQSGIISPMNFNIVSEEIQNFMKELADFRDKDAVLSPLQKEFMHVEAPIKDIVKDIKKAMPVIKDKAPQAPLDSNKIGRRNLIIKLLSQHERMGLKDFAGAIKDCSEKTIQRELLALVEEGILYKIGEKRWSTYTLASRK